MAFLSQLVKKLSGGPHVSVGAFGKCPLWSDHIYPDIALDGALSELKQSLYLEGIRDRAITSWGKVDPSQLVPFGHELLWLHEKHTVAGRLWYSRDGRERDDFPMVVAADCTGLSLDWIIAEVMPVLEGVEAGIKRATHRDTVPMLIAEATEALREKAARVDESAGMSITPGQAVLQLTDAAEMGARDEGFFRVMHVLQEIPSRGMPAAPSESIRVPRCAPTSRAAILLWARVLEARFGRVPHAIFFAPTEGYYLDVMVGKLDPAHFIALRASPHMIPLTTEIAYAVDSNVQDVVREMISAARR